MTKTNAIVCCVLAGAIIVPTLIGNCAKTDPPVTRAVASPAGEPASQAEPATHSASAFVLTDAERQSVAEFDARVADYAVLHHTLEGSLPALPDKATREQIDQHQQALVALITTARKDARRGDFFAPGMEALVRRALGALVAGPDGTSLKASIMDENPGALDVGVNDRYPDSAPVSSMPIQLLETLPGLPPELEYRFLGRHLVLVCTPARIVLDLTPNVLP